MIDHCNFQERLHMDRSFKICITFTFFRFCRNVPSVSRRPIHPFQPTLEYYGKNKIFRHPNNCYKILKVEQCGFTKRCRPNGKHCRPWSDCLFSLKEQSDEGLLCLPFHLHVATANALARLLGFAGLPEPSFLGYVITWTQSVTDLEISHDEISDILTRTNFIIRWFS